MRTVRVASFWRLNPLFARRSLSQCRSSQRIGSFLSQSKFERHCLSTLETPTRYKTLRITTTEDIERLYPLLSSYIENPSLAESVSEVIIDSVWWPSSTRYPTERESDSIDNTQLQCGEPSLNIQTYIRGLGLNDETTKKMVESLQWLAQHYSTRDTDDIPEKCCRFIEEGDKNYDRLKDFSLRRGYCARFNEEKTRLNMNYNLYQQTAVILILSLCKNIVTLRVGPADTDLCLLGDFVFQANYNLLPKPQLQKLEHVEIIARHEIALVDEFYFELDFMEFFQRFYRFPSMRSISMEGAMYFDAPRYLFVPRTSNIRKIHIGHSDLSSDLLQNIILIPKALEELHISLGGLLELEQGGLWMNPGQLSRALLQRRRTLKVLDLDVDYAHDTFRIASEESTDTKIDYAKIREEIRNIEADAYGLEYLQLDEELSITSTQNQDSPEDRDYGYTIGSLHDFTALTHLSIGLKALLGIIDFDHHQPPFRLLKRPPFRLVDALPPNLEYLCLYGYRKGENEEIDDHIQELLSKRAEKLPRLREMEGIDKPVLDLGSIYKVDDDKNLWERPERNFNWEEA